MTPKLSTTEFNALHDFYNATNGPSWWWHNISVQSTRWNFSSPDVNPCLDQWQGLGCNCGTGTCAVHVLFLDHHNLTGHLPDSMEHFTNISKLILRGNNITGTITRSIGNMTRLEELDLSYNNFQGQIPSSISRLSKLRTLNLAMNELTKIPETLYELPKLEALSLFHNRIGGILSSNVGNLSALETLQFQENDFASQLIPKELCNLRALLTLDLSYNRFIGPIPDCLFNMTSLISLLLVKTTMNCFLSPNIGNLVNIQSLGLTNANFYGAIPESIGNLTKLGFLGLDGNSFSRTVPVTFANLSNLKILLLQDNSLHGKIDFLTSLNTSILKIHENFFTGSFHIPPTGLAFIEYFDITRNLFTGSLPWNMKWERIFIYEVYENYFTGKLPLNTSSSHLQYYIISDNYISSTIPSKIFNRTAQMFYIAMDDNLLTGNIPNTFGNLFMINQISLSSNFLTGTLPDLRNNILMVVLDVSFNQLHGRLPLSLSSLEFLEELFIQYNIFTGDLSPCLNATHQRKLVNIDVSGNELTGTVPASIFAGQRLESFAASSNCFQGSISEKICHSRTLLSLSLDGLSTSDGCRMALFPGLPFFNGFTVTHFIEGTIPSCLFEMPKLQLLHLSGNGLEGSISEDLNITKTLQDLSLSHNVLTGAIPSTIQLKTWENLDLSYNKLSGTLSHNFAAPIDDGAIALEVNRLSGNIPSNLTTFNDTNILSGNIFSCNLVHSDLPRSDPDANNYSCGSENVNSVLYFWLAVFILLPLLVIIFVKLELASRSWRELVSESLHKLKLWKSALIQDDNRINLTRLSIYFSEVRRGTLRLTLYCILVLMPVYSVLKVYSSSYTVEYAWSISSMLMNGTTAAIVLFIVLMILAWLYIIILKEIIKRLNVQMPKEKKINRTSKHLVVETCGESLMIYSFILLINTAIVTMADIAYVYIVISFDSLIVSFAAFASALFRLLANHLVLWFAIPWTSKLLISVKRYLNVKDSKKTGRTNSSTEMKSKFEYTANDISFIENVILLNNIIIPCIAIVLILPDCFYNALIAAENVQSSYYYNSCYQYLPLTGISHNCRTIQAFVHYSPPYIYSYQCSSKIAINYVPVYVLMFILAGIIIPSMKLGLKMVYDRIRTHESERSKRLRVLLDLVVPEYFKDLRSDLPERLTTDNNDSIITYKETIVASRTMFVGEGEKQKKPLFSKLTMTVQMNSYLTILMCFGALFPPLALIAAISMYSITYFEELWIGWLLTETRGLGLGYGWYEEQIERECEGVEESSNLTIWSTLTVSCFLYSYMIFDTMGDSIGWEGALPMTLVMMLMPLICYGGLRLHREWLKRRSKASVDKEIQERTVLAELGMNLEGEVRQTELASLSSRITEIGFETSSMPKSQLNDVKDLNDSIINPMI